MPRCRAAAFALGALALLAALTTGAPPASAATAAFESIDTYNVVLTVQPSGVLHVEETIAYDFGTTPRHGIFREVPVRFHYDGKYDRVYKMHDIRVAASPGTPAGTKVSDSGNRKTIRIGDKNTTITGLHTYTITYDVDGALNGFSEHQELYWNAIGTEWTVSVARPSVAVRSPAATTAVACFSGVNGSNAPCDTPAKPGAKEADFSNGPLSPGEALTVVVSLPLGTVAQVGPVLDERWSPARAFAVTPATMGGSGLVAAAAVGGLGWLFWRRGRDRRVAGGLPGPLAPEGAAGDDETVPLFADRAGPVVYRPPDGLRPAQIGVLIDERADPLDVTATIVDLAVRGYLAIEEVEGKHRWSKSDWKLTERKEADDALLPYEADLLRSIFTSRTEVTLSDLKDTFHTALVRVQGTLYDDAVERGWFTSRPDKVRTHWLVLGIGLAVVGLVAVVFMAAFTHLALIAVPVLVAGIVLAVGHRWMPARTSKGSAALAQTLGFRRYIETAEADRMQFAEEENVWASYLPYAIVFGATKKWAAVFSGLGAEQQAAVSAWYISPYAFDPIGFSGSMQSFTTSAAGAIVSTPSSSGGSGFSGGFSGGGGGGGGGGSW